MCWLDVPMNEWYAFHIAWWGSDRNTSHWEETTDSSRLRFLNELAFPRIGKNFRWFERFKESPFCNQAKRQRFIFVSFIRPWIRIINARRWFMHLSPPPLHQARRFSQKSIASFQVRRPLGEFLTIDNAHGADSSLHLHVHKKFWHAHVRCEFESYRYHRVRLCYTTPLIKVKWRMSAFPIRIHPTPKTQE